MRNTPSTGFRSSIGPYLAARIRGAACVAAAAAIVAATVSPAAAADCVTPAEKVAFDVRGLQSRLMVAALTCNARGEYNDFVVKYRPSLQRHSKTMIGYFHRQYGPASNRHLNAFVTQTANEASELSAVERATFCADTMRIFQSLAASPHGEIETSTLLDMPPTRVASAQNACAETSMKMN